MSVFTEWVRKNVADPKEIVLRRRIASVLLLDVALGLVLVWLSLMVQDIGYRIDNTGKLIEKLDLEHAELVAEAAQQASPDRLRRVAETTLGLGVPHAGQVLRLDPFAVGPANGAVAASPAPEPRGPLAVGGSSAASAPARHPAVVFEPGGDAPHATDAQP